MRPPETEPFAHLQPLHHLDTLWIQVAGTLCNLTCTHCFVSCGPTAGRHAMMSRELVRARVAEGLALGVKEVYFTGGEPFLHRDLLAILEDTLALAPATVLTNGTLFTAPRVAALAALAGRSRFSLELRVSLDGPDAATHDALRGAGSFRRTLEGLRALGDAGLLPIVTVTRAPADDPLELSGRYVAMLRAEGVPQPRLKLLPLFRIGREAERSGGYAAGDTLDALSAEAFDPHRLQCGACRAVAADGVYVCPLLVNEPGGRMGDTLADAARPFALTHGACATCWHTGMSCANG
jgi:AdoMet-dependent heme synthase